MNYGWVRWVSGLWMGWVGEWSMDGLGGRMDYGWIGWVSGLWMDWVGEWSRDVLSGRFLVGMRKIDE